MKKKIVITGTAGLLGPYVVDHFLELGYDVLSVDLQTPKTLKCRHWTVDLNDLGQVYGMLQGAYGVVHLAAIPRADIYPNATTFQNNIMSSYNIMEACGHLGIQKVVIASSECAYGLCFAKEDLVPEYVPVDEKHPAWAEDCYGIAKIAAEVTAEGMHRRFGTQIINFRLGNIITPEMYNQIFPTFINDTYIRMRNLWNYIDARDIATACRLAIEVEGLGAQVMNIGADDTCQAIKSIELVRAEFPLLTDIRSDLDGYQPIYCNKKAKEMLGWQPVHFWRTYVTASL
ncbi:MAG: NAD(P)-dependent oxidoreductase [Defluviitaleaceae bacterium]|nr:NAD(P)-dependent oxidoreductase [Defluviitaleaceae bacterium]